MELGVVALAVVGFCGSCVMVMVYGNVGGGGVHNGAGVGGGWLVCEVRYLVSVERMAMYLHHKRTCTGCGYGHLRMAVAEAYCSLLVNVNLNSPCSPQCSYGPPTGLMILPPIAG